MIDGGSELSRRSFIETTSFLRLQQTLSLQNFSPLLSQGKRWERRDGQIKDNQFKESTTLSVKGKRPLDAQTGKPIPKDTNLVDFLGRDEQLQQLVRIGLQTGAVNLTDIQNLLSDGLRITSLSAGGEDPQKVLFDKPLNARRKTEIIALVLQKIGDSKVAQRGRYIQEITNAMNAQVERTGPHAGIALDQADYITALSVAGGDALVAATDEADYNPYAFTRNDPSRRKVVDTVFHPTGTQHAREFSPLTDDTGKSLFAEKTRRRKFDSVKKTQQMLNREQDVLVDLASAQLLFNDMLPPDVIVEMGLLDLQIQREPDLVKREDLRHELVKKRQKAYIAILQANGVKGFNRTITKDPLNTAVHIEEGNQIQWLMENGHLTEQDVVEIQGRYKIAGEDVAQAKDGTYAYEKIGLVGRIRKRMKGLDRSTSVLNMNRLAMTDMLTANSEVIGNRKLNVADTVSKTIQSFDISSRHIEELKKDPTIASLPDSSKTEKAYEKMWEELQQKLHENGIRMKKTKSEDTQKIVKSFIQDRIRTELKLKENRPLKADSHFAANVETTSFGEVEDQALKGIDLLYRRTLSEKAQPQYHGLEDANYRTRLETVVDRLDKAIQLTEQEQPETKKEPVAETAPVTIPHPVPETETSKEIQDKIDQIVADRIRIAEQVDFKKPLKGELGDTDLIRLTRFLKSGKLTLAVDKQKKPARQISLNTDELYKLAQTEPELFLEKIKTQSGDVPRSEDETREVLADYLTYHAIRRVIQDEVVPGVHPSKLTEADKKFVRIKMDTLNPNLRPVLKKQIKKALEKVEGVKPKTDTTETKPPNASQNPVKPAAVSNLPEKNTTPPTTLSNLTTPAQPTTSSTASSAQPTPEITTPETTPTETLSALILPPAFQKARDFFDDLQRQHGSSPIPDTVIAEHQAELMIQDNEGQYWQPMPNNRWWKFDNDGKEWIVATPPIEPPQEPPTEAQTTPSLSPTSPTVQTSSSSSTQPQEATTAAVAETAGILSVPPPEIGIQNEFIHASKEVFDYLREEVLAKQTKIQSLTEYNHLHDELTTVMEDFAQMENAFDTNTNLPNSTEAELKIRNTIRTTLKILNEVSPNTYIPIGKMNLTDGDRFVVMSQGKLQILRTHRLGATGLFRDVQPDQLPSIQVFDELRATEQWKTIKPLLEQPVLTTEPASSPTTAAPPEVPVTSGVGTTIDDEVARAREQLGLDTPPIPTSVETTTPPTLQAANTGTWSPFGVGSLLRRIERSSVTESDPLDLHEPLIPQVKEALQSKGTFHYGAERPEVVKAIMGNVIREILKQDIPDNKIQNIEIGNNNVVLKVKVPYKAGRFAPTIDVGLTLNLIYKDNKLTFNVDGGMAQSFVNKELAKNGLNDPNADIQPLILEEMKRNGIDASSVQFRVINGVILLDITK